MTQLALDVPDEKPPMWIQPVTLSGIECPAIPAHECVGGLSEATGWASIFISNVDQLGPDPTPQEIAEACRIAPLYWSITGNRRALRAIGPLD